MARFYRLVHLVIDLLVLRGRRDGSKDVEILVLRHQLAIVQRQIVRARFEPDDRAPITALARVLGRDRWWHCCVGRESDTTPAPLRAGHVCESNETVDSGPHESPI